LWALRRPPATVIDLAGPPRTAALASRPWSDSVAALRTVVRDDLYRGSLILLINTACISGIGFVFWALAARHYAASAVGVFAGITSGVSLLAAIAALGLPNALTRHIASAEDPLRLVATTVAAIGSVGTVVCALTVLVLGPHLPPSLGLRQHGWMLLLVSVLVAFTAASSALDSGLIALRSTQTVLVKNLLGSTVKLAALVLLTSLHSLGLLVAYGLGLVISTCVEAARLLLTTRRRRKRRLGLRELRQYLTLASGNYVATIFGILPLSLVPIEVILARGTAATARFSVAFLVAGFLNFIPSTVAQVLFAEASRRGEPLSSQLRKAIRGVYALLLPSVAIVVAAAPLALRLFGSEYALAATNCLRVLALSTLVTGGTYLVDALLIARDRVGAYIFINGANAALVLGFVWVMLRRGLTGAAEGWAFAQALSLVVGLALLATGKLGRHHPVTGAVRSAYSPADAPAISLSVLHAFEPQIRDALAAWPLVPTTAIAEQIGWNQSPQLLLNRVIEMRGAYVEHRARLKEVTFGAGQVTELGIWFAPTEVPVEAGQKRSGMQLPVLLLVSSYSRWAAGLLIPSVLKEDVFLGWWHLLSQLGAAPRTLIWNVWGNSTPRDNNTKQFLDACRVFCDSLGTGVVFGGARQSRAGSVFHRLHSELEAEFLPGREFVSPGDFNAQLAKWMDTRNSSGTTTGESFDQLLVVDRDAMLPLPEKFVAPSWRSRQKVDDRALVHFDSCDYSVAPAAIGQTVEIFVDLDRLRVKCGNLKVADHERIWARNRMIADPHHLTS
jgi:O-antigen/teichoic acid export membrane protein